MTHLEREQSVIIVDELVLLHQRLAVEQEQLEREFRAENQGRHRIQNVDGRQRVESLEGEVGRLAVLE